MKSAKFKEPFKFEVVDVPVPEPKGKEVLIKVDYCAICGSDLHTYTMGVYVESGQVMGHEFGGTVAAVGPEYDGEIKVGDRVVTNPTVACGHCLMCRKGTPNICMNALTATLAYGRPGAFAEYVLQGEGAFIYKLPDNVSTKEGALMEPLAVAVHAVKRARIALNDKVVVFGAGTIGIMVTQILKTIGCVEVIQVDVSQSRLDIAKQVGADYIINAEDSDDVIAEIAAITGPGFYGPDGAQADVVFECAAVPVTVVQSVKVVRHGGQIVTIALAEEAAPINVTSLVQKEITLSGAYAYTNDFEEAIALVASGKISLEPLITDVFPLTEIKDGFDRQRDTKGSIKVVIQCTPDI